MILQDYEVTAPSLGPLARRWIRRHCCVPDGFAQGDPFVCYPWQRVCTDRHYMVRAAAQVGQLSTAFTYRRSIVIAPQKTGKGPWSATIALFEAAGPSVFVGWALGGERYRCKDNGCGCGWVYEYKRAEPMGTPRPTPLIQLTATSEDQVANVYRPLQNMIRQGPLSEFMKVGEEFTRIGVDGRIDVVTSSALSRLGNPVTFVLCDESGVYTTANKMRKVAETQRRGAAGMGARTMETTNPWDPADDSVAQRGYETKATDVFKFWIEPPAAWSFHNKAERRKILKYVYAGSAHVDLDAIEAEAAEIMEKDPAQAERFFGNRVVYGVGSWIKGDDWDKLAQPREVPEGTAIVVGFDGSDVDDTTALRCETAEGYQFTPKFADGRAMWWDPAEHGGQVPRLEVDAAVNDLFARYNVVRMYCDPPYWETEVDQWSEKYGDDKVVRWATYRPVQMHAACERLITDVHKRDTVFHHDGDLTTGVHIRNTRKSPRPGERYVLGKPSQAQKIDIAVTSVICHEAAGDVTKAGLWPAAYSAYFA